MQWCTGDRDLKFILLNYQEATGATAMENIRYRHLAFSVDNILLVMTEIDYGIPLVRVLEIPSVARTAIENEYTTNDEGKRAAVHYFYQNHPYSSWRLLILNFDQTYGPEVADTIRHLAEKLTDATFTNENVSAVLASVPTHNLPSVLWIPESRIKQIQTLSHSKTDERIGFIKYFLECSVLAKWNSLAGLLYFSQQFDSLEAAKKFITITCESTLTLDALTSLLSNVDWKVVGSWLQIPVSKLEGIRFPIECQCREACWKLFLDEHPYPSWRLVAWSLIYCGYHKELQEVQQYCLRGDTCSGIVDNPDSYKSTPHCHNSGHSTVSAGVPTAPAEVTLQDVAAQAGIKRLDILDQECSQQVLLSLAKHCVDWQLIGFHLGLTKGDIVSVDGDCRSVDEKRIGMLGRWKEKFAFKATYRVFITALLSCGKASDATEACKAIVSS